MRKVRKGCCWTNCWKRIPKPESASSKPWVLNISEIKKSKKHKNNNKINNNKLINKSLRRTTMKKILYKNLNMNMLKNDIDLKTMVQSVLSWILAKSAYCFQTTKFCVSKTTKKFLKLLKQTKNLIFNKN